MKKMKKMKNVFMRVKISLKKFIMMVKGSDKFEEVFDNNEDIFEK